MALWRGNILLSVRRSDPEGSRSWRWALSVCGGDGGVTDLGPRRGVGLCQWPHAHPPAEGARRCRSRVVPRGSWVTAIQSRYSGRTSPTWLHARRALGVRTPGTGREVGSGARSPAGSWLSLPLASPHSAPPRPQPAWSAQSVLRACQQPPLCPVTPFSVWTLRLPSWQSSEGQVSMSPEPW